MKLKSNFKHGNPKQWLAFIHLGQETIALEFALRLAAYFEYVKHKGYASSGYRDVEYQRKLYEQNCKEHPPNGDGYVAKPGNSWHNGRCAIDLQDNGFWKNYMESGDIQKTVKQQELYKFGLCLPLNHKDAHTVFEWWHIQPIETFTYMGDRTKFLDKDDKFYSNSYVFKENDNMFKDDKNIALWAKPSVDKLEKLKIISGDNEGNFNPKNPITREEMAVVLDRILQSLGK